MMSIMASQPRRPSTRPASRAWAGVAAAAGMAALSTAGCATGAVLSVGPGHPYAKPCQAIAAAQAGDTIEIDAAGNGTYDGDVCSWSTNNLTIRGVNGRAHIDAAGHNSAGKGTWVIDANNTTVSNVELSGAAVPDQNGAGIRQEGTGLTVVGSSFHDNEDGILTGANSASDIVIDSSEFAHNGHGDGFSHNMYIGAVRTFTLRYSYSHDVNVGHLVKSRAATNNILYNRLTEQAGTGSYELDLPNGGVSFVIGNAIQQGPTTQNPAMVAYGEEGVTNPSSQLYLVNNTFVNDKGSGTAAVIGGAVTTSVLAQNNISTGSPTFVSQTNATLTTNCLAANPVFADRAHFDYHLASGSPCVDLGSPPGSGPGYSLVPNQQYEYDVDHVARSTRGAAIDAGAFER
jgi:hypothetical protein